MSQFKDVMKKGWHPGGKSASTSEGASSSSSKSVTGLGLRGKATGLMGRGKDSADDDRANHVSRPLASLKDPASFAPPPKRTGAGLAPPPPPSGGKRKVIESPSKYIDPRAPPPPRDDEYQDQHQQLQLEAPPPENVPYRTDTTGLRTDNLPLPPGRRDGADGRSPPPYEAAVGGGAPPSLPPRLPPRTNSGSPSHTGGGHLNQGAVNRLGAAGVSVPALGIGRSSPAHTASPSPPPPPRPTASAGTSNANGNGNGHGAAGGGGYGAQVNELQNRFSRLGSSSSTSTASPAAATPPPLGQGTTWAQKQAALKTASSFHKDPSSVSLSDARAAASTANNFRQRHGEQIAAGVKSANSLNQKYGLADKVGAYAGQGQAQGQAAPQQGNTAAVASALAGKKKPPPPPPKKKPGLGGSSSAAPADDAPPPVPMSTRPTF
ncbi:hypothetical protein O9K51_05208 [Purpureocillium lavendulum]|uniref:GMP synthase n=1 Tax=Purpureocillium lavendulum TaxID=1247861 RepID=A0AB34FQV5_9HYPO|nr:hypothetical protein O9K51_05208 [Purpureocillium lavendulum]